MTHTNDTFAYTIWIDADACPRLVLQATLALAKSYEARVQTVSTWRHELTVPGHITVDAAPQATDLAILSRMVAGDIVITQDYGLAALVLARRGLALSPGGLVFTEHNIDTLLSARADMARLRRAHRPRAGEIRAPRLKGPSARSHEDDRHFEQALVKLLEERAAAR